MKTIYWVILLVILLAIFSKGFTNIVGLQASTIIPKNWTPEQTKNIFIIGMIISLFLFYKGGNK